ncbi:MAG TPA: Mur ligase family protein, partial [Acidimicrobiales bacterium]|nr:Mur ligase family protein [Acidimicrobiales bacterium]
ATAAVVGLGPLGLAPRGRSAPLRWTRRLRTLAVVWGALVAGAVAGGVVAGAGPLSAAAAAVVAPALVDLACLLTAPLEVRLAGAHVARAAARLRRVHPTVVAITGSYGKTTTKGYVAHLVAARHAVVATPASFNNRAGLARTVNEHLGEDTEVFVAEMGTYAKGEIADLCSWVTPDIAVLTAIGPVHLERFGSEARVLEAKEEIFERAACAVVVVDDERLARAADRCAGRGLKVWRVSARRRDADVFAGAEDGALSVWVGGRPVAERLPVDVRPENVAAAVAVALELGVPAEEIGRLLPTLPGAPHRLERSVSAGGVVVLDDTYNANPAGARVALATFERAGAAARRRVVVTPGMVELGPRQGDENARFGAQAAAVATDVVVVGRTNRRALVRGARHGAGARVVTVATRQRATAWVREQLGHGDVVLYENDLPDHYP